MTEDNASVAATYIWSAILALPVGAVSGFWSGNIRAALYGFASVFVPTAITFFVMNTVRENERKREAYEDRLFKTLDGITRKLDKLVSASRGHGPSQD